MEIFYVILAVVALLLVLGVSTYNSLIAKRNDVKSIYSSIDVELTKRYELIPNLVAAIKQYLKHESSTLENITKIRQNAMSSSNALEKFRLNNELSLELKKLAVQVESYPELKASANFLQLQATLKDCEEQISATRRAYNAAVNAYNSACESFPTQIIANLFHFKLAHFYEASEQAKQNPDLKALFDD